MAPEPVWQASSEQDSGKQIGWVVHSLKDNGPDGVGKSTINQIIKQNIDGLRINLIKA